jgi:hypothetical protein
MRADTVAWSTSNSPVSEIPLWSTIKHLDHRTAKAVLPGAPDYGMLKQFAKTNQLGDFRANKLQMAGGNVPRFGAGVRANPSKFQKYPDLPK